MTRRIRQRPGRPMQAGCNRPPSLRRAAVIDLPVGSRHSTRWRPNLWPGGPGCTEERSVEDVKRTYREGEEKTKEAWRGVGGTDAEDEIGNAGDDIRKGLGNAGDELRRDDPDSADDADRASWEVDR